jgi:hypothetical protein
VYVFIDLAFEFVVTAPTCFEAAGGTGKYYGEVSACDNAVVMCGRRSASQRRPS